MEAQTLINEVTKEDQRREAFFIEFYYEEYLKGKTEKNMTKLFSRR